MYRRFKRNTRPHFPVYNSTGKDKVIMIHDDEKVKHDSELLRQIHPLLNGFLLIGVDLRPQCAVKNNCFRETVIKGFQAIIHIFSCAFVLLIIYGTFTDKNIIPFKQGVANRLGEILTIFLRNVLYWHQKDILKTLTHLSDAYEKYVYRNNPHSLQELKQNIFAEIAATPAQSRLDLPSSTCLPRLSKVPRDEW
ncbi:hypothetical protein TNCV_3458011 [Trichonephila clavipes]|nr:hypothetical protein TNCV_3458011 [Trichonephila clavipes]